MHSLGFHVFSSFLRPFLPTLGVVFVLTGCSLFRAGGDSETTGTPSDEITVTDVDIAPGETNLLAQATTATNATSAVPGMTDAAPLVVYSLPSPNFDERRLPVSLIVLHYTAAPLAKSLNALRSTRGTKRVSAHYVVAPNGKIYRLVDESKRAWHAGHARWGDIVDVNSASIGIEMVNLGHDGNGRPRPYPTRQIEAVIRLCLNIQGRYRITDVVGHSDVAPQRKIDPGELFPWGTLARKGVKVRKPVKPARR